MTVRVRVTHDEPGILRNIVVTTSLGDATVSALSINPGESHEFYIHNGNKLTITEEQSANG